MSKVSIRVLNDLEIRAVWDDIGNRIEAEGRDYTTNNLNQYTAIDTFTPTYDLDGNQTTIQTSTGIWNVEYNVENRPVRWTQGDIEIEMAYDRMGRRIVYHETRNGSNYINAKFVYNGYLCIQRLYGGSNGVYQSFVWDPTEQVATRPLCMQVPSWGSTVFYMHDGNKNVSDVIYYAVANGIAAHYDYAPFGAITRTARDTRMTGRDFIGENPFRFSSEYHDNTLGLVYYNYRHYNPLDGRWCGRDSIGEVDLTSLYSQCNNNLIINIDLLGLKSYEIVDYDIHINAPELVTLADVERIPLYKAFASNNINFAIEQMTTSIVISQITTNFGTVAKSIVSFTSVVAIDIPSRRYLPVDKVCISADVYVNLRDENGCPDSRETTLSSGQHVISNRGVLPKDIFLGAQKDKTLNGIKDAYTRLYENISIYLTNISEE